MNERIKELILEAGFPKFDKMYVVSDGEELEKFAELIVAEMYVFMCNSTDNHKPWPSFKKVKAHFGVEE